jgi:hypothetical protein
MRGSGARCGVQTYTGKCAYCTSSDRNSALTHTPKQPVSYRSGRGARCAFVVHRQRKTKTRKLHVVTARAIAMGRDDMVQPSHCDSVIKRCTSGNPCGGDDGVLSHDRVHGRTKPYAAATPACMSGMRREIIRKWLRKLICVAAEGRTQSKPRVRYGW